MPRMVMCAKLKQELEGLDRKPWPGELGERVYASISKDAWKLWLGELTIFLNETRIDPTAPASQKAVAARMEAYFFGPEPPPSALPLLK